MFTAAGFTEVSRPTLRRVVMRIDFYGPQGTSANAGRALGVSLTKDEGRLERDGPR
jgi:hypothetical protein